MLFFYLSITVMVSADQKAKIVYSAKKAVLNFVDKINLQIS